MKKAIILFTRVPIPGKTKTRMMPELTPLECARLHICFLKDIQSQCEETGEDIFVCYTPEDKKKILTAVLGKGKQYFPQQGEDLGQRMYEAMEAVCKKGYEACVLLGADVPEITAYDLNQAFRMLETRDVVFGPTEDGGYYLVGMKTPIKEVFQRQLYGQGTVLKDTLCRLDAAGFSTGLLHKYSDMDTLEDLQGYRKRAKINKKLETCATKRYLESILQISIIIPIYNEEKTIAAMQQQLKNLEKHCEILFVDGGSSDRTLERLDSGFKFIHAPKGRASQMNAGARKSRGDILFFLHCDSELPMKALEQIRHVMKRYRAGCFGIAFHSRNFFMLTCRMISNLRIKDRRVMFGDQGIFIERRLFFEIGLFPELPVMEDYQLSLNLKERGEKLGVTRKRIYTSDRRFPKGTIPKLKIMWKMNRMRKAYRDGVPADKIAVLYEDVR